MKKSSLVIAARTVAFVALGGGALNIALWWVASGFPMDGAAPRAAVLGIDPGMFLFLAKVAGAICVSSGLVFAAMAMTAYRQPSITEVVPQLPKTLRVQRLQRLEAELLDLQSKEVRLGLKIAPLVTVRGRRAHKGISIEKLMREHGQIRVRIEQTSQLIRIELQKLDELDHAQSEAAALQAN